MGKIFFALLILIGTTVTMTLAGVQSIHGPNPQYGGWNGYGGGNYNLTGYNSSYTTPYYPNQSGYNPNYGGGSGGLYNQYGTGGYNPNYNSGYNPNYNSGYNPNYNPGYNQNTNPGYNTNYNPGYNPNYNPQTPYYNGGGASSNVFQKQPVYSSNVPYNPSAGGYYNNNVPYTGLYGGKK